MLLATTKVEDFDRWLKIFSTTNAVKRKQHGGWQSFVSDPEVPAIMKEAGHKSKPQAATFAARFDS